MKAKTIAFNHISQTIQQQKKQILKKISAVLSSGIFLNGIEGKKLTKNLQSFLGPGYLTLCASCHDALFLALQALKIEKEDEIIFPVNAYPTAFPVCLQKGIAVPCDVDENGQMDPGSLAKRISKRTKAVILVHLYGLCGRITDIRKIVKQKNIYLIEDCAQAFGSEYQNNTLGTLGDIGCFSFYPTKNLRTLGDGGAIFTRHKRIADYLGKAVSYGENKHYQSEFIAGHSRIPEIQAGIINCLFSKTLNDFAKRRKLVEYYHRKIKKADIGEFVQVLKTDSLAKPVVHLFVIKAKKRNKLINYLSRQGIPTLIHYPRPVHLVKAFSYLGYKKGNFPRAEEQSQQILSLPFHPSLSKTEVDRIIQGIKNFYESKGA